MLFFRVSSVICLALSLSSCGFFTAKETDGAGSTGIHDKKAKEEIRQMKEISGRWRSSIAPLPDLDRKWIILDISNDKKVSMEIRSTGPKLEIVQAFARGDLVPLEGGSGFKASVAGGTGMLTEVREILIVPGSAGVIQLQSKIGNVDLKYTGL